MPRSSFFIIFFLFPFILKSQIVITEIMYNPPESGTDSLEYIELFNSSDIMVNLNGYSFSNGVTHTFGNLGMPAGTYLIVAESSSAMLNVFGLNVIQWDDGALRNSGEQITLVDNGGNIMDDVTYDDGDGWPLEPDGSGASLELCDPFVDNSFPVNWFASNTATGIFLNGAQIFATPMSMNAVNCSEEPETEAIVITEIMYNDPGVDDSIEFIELFNAGATSVDLSGWDFGGAVVYTFGGESMSPGDYLVITNNSAAFNTNFGFSPLQWDSDGLNNAGELVLLRNSEGNTVDSVNYSDTGGWPLDADGLGSSLVLCDPSLDNAGPSNWKAAATETNAIIDGTDIFANPLSPSYCKFIVDEVDNLNMQNVPIAEGWFVQLQGIAHGINLRPGGLQFTLIDGSGEGIGAIRTNTDFGVSYAEGDEFVVRGCIGNFNGLTQINLDTAWVVSAGNTLNTPRLTTALDESTESQLVKLENVRLKTPSQWNAIGSGFNVTLTDGSNDYEMRIDADVDLYDMAYPAGTFAVTGIGGQFDNTTPFDMGYQLLPRYMEDIDPYIPFEEQYPKYSVGLISTVNESGLPDSAGVSCEIQGIVYGINTQPSGLQFTLIDESNDGISVFSDDQNFGYSVNEGDELIVRGKIGHYNGLLEIAPDTLWMVSSGNTLVEPLLVTILGEDTESQLVKLENLVFSNASQWAGDGTSFNVDVENDNGAYTLRIDNDNELSTMAAPTEPFNATGLGGQFDSSSPHDSGYQLLPRYNADIEMYSTVNDIIFENGIKIYPIPAINQLNIESEIEIDEINVYDLSGKTIHKYTGTGNKLINLNNYKSGYYIIQFKVQDKVITGSFIKT